LGKQFHEDDAVQANVQFARRLCVLGIM